MVLLYCGGVVSGCGQWCVPCMAVQSSLYRESGVRAVPTDTALCTQRDITAQQRGTSDRTEGVVLSFTSGIQQDPPMSSLSTSSRVSLSV